MKTVVVLLIIIFMGFAGMQIGIALKEDFEGTSILNFIFGFTCFGIVLAIIAEEIIAHLKK